MGFRFRRAPLWIVLNLAGMLIYLWLASDLWTVPGEEGLPGGPGDAFYWVLMLAPILLIFLTVNLLALYAIIRKTRRTGRLSSLGVWVIVAGLWMITNGYDNHRSFRIICPANQDLLINGVCQKSH